MRWLVILLAGLLCLAMTSCPGGDEDTTTSITTNGDNGGDDGGDNDVENWDE